MKCNVLPLSTLLAIVLVQAVSLETIQGKIKNKRRQHTNEIYVHKAPSTSEMPGWGASEYSSNILGRDPDVVKDVIHLPRRKKNHEPRPLMQKRNPTPFVDISNISAYACEVSSPKYITNGYEDATMDQVGVILQKIADDGTGLPALPSCTGEETCWGVCTTIACHEQTLVLGCNNVCNS